MSEEIFEAGAWYGPESATFGDRVTAAREAAGLSRGDLAARLGVRLETLEAWEEDMAEPRGNKLQMLSGVTGVSIPWLLTGAGRGPGGPEAERAPAPIAPVLAEIRAVKAEMTALVGRLGRLEAQLSMLAEDRE